MTHDLRQQRRRWFRSALGLGVAGAAVALGVAVEAVAHTPYKQWTVYRRKHLLLGCHKDEPATYTLAKQLVALLEDHLPEASARVARAPTAQRLASLMATDQLDSAIVAQPVAVRMAAGSDEFVPYGKIALRQLKQFGQHVLICRADIPDRHAYLIAAALDEPAVLAVSEASANRNSPDTIPWHPGVLRLQAGEKI